MGWLRNISGRRIELLGMVIFVALTGAGILTSRHSFEHRLDGALEEKTREKQRKQGGLLSTYDSTIVDLEFPPVHNEYV